MLLYRIEITKIIEKYGYWFPVLSIKRFIFLWKKNHTIDIGSFSKEHGKKFMTQKQQKQNDRVKVIIYVLTLCCVPSDS